MNVTTTDRPRIHLTAETLAVVKARAASTHADHYRRLIEAADEYVALGKPRPTPRRDGGIRCRPTR
jgi:hypothetical protein